MAHARIPSARDGGRRIEDGTKPLDDGFHDIRNETLAGSACLRECIDAVAAAVHKAARRGEIAMEQRFFDRAFLALDEAGQQARGKKCKGMKGLLEEGEELIKEEEGDAGLICAAQKVEHYEIATYGCLHSWARLLKEEDAADLLEETLDEEEATDERLTELAETAINVEESQEEGGDEEQQDSEHAKSGHKGK